MAKGRIFALLGALGLTAGCGTLDYEPVVFSAEGGAIVARGEIDSGALDRFKVVARANPEARLLVLDHVAGSVDDRTNLRLSRYVREQGFATRVPGTGLVASGGTDLFLAGVTRVLEPGACVGVHSWIRGRTEGRDLARDDPEHWIYLNYFEDIGTPEGFYWYTLDVAGADEIHWMSSGEANRYRLTSRGSPRLSGPGACDFR